MEPAPTARPATPYSPRALEIELFLVQGSPGYERQIADKYIQHWQSGFFYGFDLTSMQTATTALIKTGLGGHAKAVKQMIKDPVYNELTMARFYAERGETAMMAYFLGCARRGAAQHTKVLHPSVLEKITKRCAIVAAWKGTTTKAFPAQLTGPFMDSDKDGRDYDKPYESDKLDADNDAKAAEYKRLLKTKNLGALVAALIGSRYNKYSSLFDDYSEDEKDRLARKKIQEHILPDDD